MFLFYLILMTVLNQDIPSKKPLVTSDICVASQCNLNIIFTLFSFSFNNCFPLTLPSFVIIFFFAGRFNLTLFGGTNYWQNLINAFSEIYIFHDIQCGIWAE